MNKKIVEQLVEMEIFKQQFISKEDYEKLSAYDGDDSHILLKGNYNGDGIHGAWYKDIDTYGLTEEEIKLQLEIDRTKNIRSIKSMMKFFVVLTVLSMILAFVFGMSLM